MKIMKRDLITVALVTLFATITPLSLVACGDSSEGKVILQYNGQTVTFTREEYDRLLAQGIDPHDALLGLPKNSDNEDENDEGQEARNTEDSQPSFNDTVIDNGNAANTGSSISIEPSEVSQIKFSTVTEPNGYFTCQVPSGWQVNAGMSGDIISYDILMYDPSNPDRRVYYQLNTVGLKSQEAYDWYATYGLTSEYQNMMVINSPTTESFFNSFGQKLNYNNFKVLENTGSNGLGGEVLIANCTSSQTGRTLEGIFSATVTDGVEMPVKKNPAQFTSEMIDGGYRTVFTIVAETTPEEEFIDWQPVLDYCLSTIQFSQSLLSERQSMWRQIMGTSNYIMQNASEISDMIMDSYEYRNKTYDVESQKYSDATLGYERVLDTQTGDYYKAELGFGDWYDGTRYQTVDDDTAYLSQIEGTINWK